MPLSIYLVLLTIEFTYMIAIPASKIITGDFTFTTILFRYMTAQGVYAFVICVTIFMAFQVLFVFLRGRALKNKQSKGNES